MRVSHVITRLIVGGAQENTIASVLGLACKPDIQVELISGPSPGSEGSLEQTVSSLGSHYIQLPHLIRPIQPLADWTAYRQLTRHYSNTQPDIVHTHSGKAGVLGRLAAKAAGVPVIIHTIHGPSFGPFQGFFANQLFQFAERRAGRVTTHFVVVACSMQKQYLAAGIGVPDQYTRIFSGFDLNPFLQTTHDPQLATQLGLVPGDFVVGKIARLFKLKGHDDLFLAAHALIERIPNLKLLLVGDGPWRAKFEDLAARSPLAGRVIFTGLVPPSEVPRYVGLMDALIHLSRREGLPRALPQALAAGKPVVAYDCDGASEICRTNETGFLLKAGDTTGLVNALAELASNQELRRRLGETGRAWVSTRFSTEKMVEDLETLYRRLCPAPFNTRNPLS